MLGAYLIVYAVKEWGKRRGGREEKWGEKKKRNLTRSLFFTLPLLCEL